MQPKVLYGYLALPRLDGSKRSRHRIDGVCHGRVDKHHYGLPYKTYRVRIHRAALYASWDLRSPARARFPMPTEVAHVRAALIGHVASFDTVASLDAWIESNTEENRLLDTPLPLAEAIREAGYILAARAALHVKSLKLDRR
jgi:hypothetical protein